MKTILFTLAAVIPSLAAFSQSWIQLNSLPTGVEGRNHPITFALDGHGYMLTGNSNTGDLSDFLRYDPATDSWTQLPNFPGGERGYAYGVATNGKGYAGFGLQYDFSTGSETYFGDLWEYDPSNSTWTELATCPCEARIHPAMIATDTKIFVGLGGGETSGDLNDWWEYDIASDTWSQKPNFPSTQRHHPYYFSIDNIPYVGFGHHQAQIFNDFYKYDPASGTWQQLASLPDQGRVAGTQFTYNGKGYALSGQGETHQNLPTGEFWEYDPVNDDWTQLPAHPGTGRWAPGSFVIDDKVYMSGGQTTFEERDLWVFDFVSFLSVDQPQLTTKFNILPNPSTGIFNISSEAVFNELLIYNITGQLVKRVPENTFQIDLSDLGTGLYYLQFIVEGESVSKKVQVY